MIVPKEKQVPVLYKRKEECCGCSACFAICPRSAISMKTDEEGFEYPVINPELCVCCGMCVSVCPIKASKRSRRL